MDGTQETPAINEIKETMVVIIDYINNLSQVVDLQGKLIRLQDKAAEKLELLVQSTADIVLSTAEKVSNISDMVQGSFVEISDRFQLLELMQDAQMEYIEAVSNMSASSMLLGVFNTAVIAVIAIYLILRKR